MSLQSLIKQKFKHQDLTLVASKLGFTNIEKLSGRIKEIVESPLLGLEQSSYDFNCSTPELIRKLCSLLDIPLLLCNTIIEEIQEEIFKQKQSVKSYIFIETNFERANQPIFALAILEGLRNISVDSDIKKLSLNNQIDEIKTIIQQHYKTQTSLKIWGDIQQYVYFYKNDIILVFSPQGNCIKVVNEYQCSKAVLIFNGKKITGTQC